MRLCMCGCACGGAWGVAGGESFGRAQAGQPEDFILSQHMHACTSMHKKDFIESSTMLLKIGLV